MMLEPVDFLQRKFPGGTIFTEGARRALPRRSEGSSRSTVTFHMHYTEEFRRFRSAGLLVFTEAARLRRVANGKTRLGIERNVGGLTLCSPD